MRISVLFPISIYLLPLILLGGFFISCTKDSGSNSSPNPTGPKPTIVAPTPPTGWYDSTVTGSFTVTSAGNYSVSISTDNGTPIQLNGNTYTLTGVKGLTKVNITATNSNGSSIVTVNISVYSEVVTNFSVPINGAGPWRRTEVYYSTDSITWNLATGIMCVAPTEFRPNFTCYLFSTQCGSPADFPNAPWSYNDGFVTWMGKTQNVFSLSKRQFAGIVKTVTTSVFWIKEIWKR